MQFVGKYAILEKTPANGRDRRSGMAGLTGMQQKIYDFPNQQKTAHLSAEIFLVVYKSNLYTFDGKAGFHYNNRSFDRISLLRNRETDEH